MGTMRLEGKDLVTLHGKIIVPSRLQPRIVSWYHLYLVHPGETRMEATLKQLFYWKNMREDVRRHIKHCKQCQLCKKGKRKYGELPPKEAEPAIPWNRVNVDLIGPLSVKTPSGKHTLRALTMIDPATGWFEVKEVAEATADCVSAAFDDAWLSRYPRPEYLGFDGGSEFKKEFQQLLTNYNLKPKPSTPYNPQANGIIERVHQVLNNCLRTFELQKQNLNKQDPWTQFLAATAFAIRSTYHTTLQATPAQLIYGRDMILPVQFKADWAAIQTRRQNIINANNARENRGRIPHQYKIGDKVCLERSRLRAAKLDQIRDGPYIVSKVNTNGTLEITKGVVTQVVNIRRVKPYFQEEVP